ncbi:fibronectin type III domain-containing protein 7-like [Engraulis encrasicolus]|uniref:fibronectin type III domain-containing protein 7-like n=1 Tax=Engraulis encrasicolus TaxID=184585 RepID=UPI002FD50F0D
MAWRNISVSVFYSTSRSIMVRWSRFEGASSYMVTATLPNTVITSAFAQFGGNTVLGSLNGLTTNTLYTLRVVALNSSGNEEAQGQVDGRTAPDVPTIELATSKQSDSITVEFQEVTGGASYLVRTESPDGSFLQTAVSTSPATVQGLQPYTEYIVSLLSLNSLGGQSQPSLPVTVRTVLPAPVLNTSSPSSDTIEVEWDPVDNAVQYTLTITLDSALVEEVNITSSTAHTLSGLAPGSIHHIQAYAWDAQGRPGDSSSVTQITRPAQPVDFQLSVGWDPLSLVVTWAETQGATEYTALSSTGLECSSAGSSCSLTPLYCGESMTVTLTASNQAGPSLPSQLKHFAGIPCPPSPIWLTEPEPERCLVAWDAVDTADYYVTFLKRADGIETLCNSTETSCNYTCLCGYTYVISVHAYNEVGSSPPGPLVNYTTLPCCPSDVSISLMSPETLEITWSPARGAIIYETRAMDPGEVIVCNDTAPVCALSDLNCNSQYRVAVIPCSDISGCNQNCPSQVHETGPCMPTIETVSQTNGTVRVVWRSENHAANFTASLVCDTGTVSCDTEENSCEISADQIVCGSDCDVSVIATSGAGASFPSYVVPLETDPCCPAELTVTQVTQAMSNVSWSPARGAHTFHTSLTSPRGHASCTTADTHCIVGCVTCGTSYSVSMEARSRTGRQAQCSYSGFSTSACCPTGVRLYSMANNTLLVYWRSTSAMVQYTAEVYGSQGNHTCSPTVLGGNSCDVADVTCGGIYTVIVSPINPDGTVVPFCPLRLYSVSCSGGYVGTIVYRGKRSVD